MGTSHARRNVTLLSAAAVAAGALAVPALTAVPASAATIVTNQSFTAPGTYRLVIPPGTTQITVTGLGGAGLPGNASSIFASYGGRGGAGTMVAATYNLPAASVWAGDTLQITVGAKGGGGQGGANSSYSGAGGNGGGVTYVYDGSDQTYLLVAAGGGGGGGGSGRWGDLNGGNGGTDGNGAPGVGYPADLSTGRGGALGGDPACPGGIFITHGQAGESAPSGSRAGGGGGGGGGACGGQSGGSGDHGVGQGSGGGGGAGASRTASGAIDVSRGPSNNTGDGYVVVTLSTNG